MAEIYMKVKRSEYLALQRQLHQLQGLLAEQQAEPKAAQKKSPKIAEQSGKKAQENKKPEQGEE